MFVKIMKEGAKQNSQKMKPYSIYETILDAATTVLGLLFGAYMVLFGYLNLPIEYRYSKDEIQELSEEKKRNPCPNGAAYWLYVAGIIWIVTYVLFGWTKFFKWFVTRKYKVNKCKKFILEVNSFTSVCMTIVNITMIIWGSVVVFGAYAKWTDDFNEFQKDPEALNYCMYEPMMFAFVFLIIQWTLLPFMVILTSLCLCCYCCCTTCLKWDQNQDAVNQNKIPMMY